MPGGYPRPNTLIDQAYGLLGPVAAGGMSRIYRAHSLRDALPVAVKVLDPERALQPYAVERFNREARVSMLLDHANVVDVFDFGLTAEGHWVIVMEFLGGENLHSVIRRLGRVPWQRAVHITIELSEALGHAHSRRVVHRDLKPDNVQLVGDPGPNERVKLLDFGVAYVAVDRSFSGPAPGSGGVSGTPAYMSPEQIRAQPLDGRSDLYSIGVLMFEMLTGRRPFQGTDAVTVCRRHLFDKPTHRRPAARERYPPRLAAPGASASVEEPVGSRGRRRGPAGAPAAAEPGRRPPSPGYPPPYAPPHRRRSSAADASRPASDPGAAGQLQVLGRPPPRRRAREAGDQPLPHRAAGGSH